MEHPSDLKRRLIDLGIPEDEIMFAAQEKDPQKKQALFEKVRKGEVRVLIGSTGTLGTGTNVQDRLFAIHDLDCPWKPAELEQRQGRVRRQGNMFDKAQDYRYVTVGTFDSYMFQTVERKARFISQIMSSGSPSREASDVDSTVLSLADMKAIATGDPNIAKRMELENQLTQMKLLKRAHADQQRSIRFKIDMQLQPTVDNLERLHGEAVDDEPKFHKAVEIRDQHLAQGVCGLDLGDGPITDRKQAIHDLVGIAHRLDHGQTMEVGEYCGLTVMVASKNMAVKGINAFRPFVGLKGEHEHWAGTSVPDINNSADNVIRQLDRIIANNADTAQGLRVRLDNAKANLESAWNALNTPWEGQQEYDDLTDQIAKMNLEIKNSQDNGAGRRGRTGHAADLAKASYHSDGPAEAQAASVTVGFDPSEPSAFPTAAETTDVPMPDPCIDPSDDVPPDRESACDVGIRIRERRAGTGANPIRPVPISAGPHVNRLERKRGRIGPMSETEELKTRIETIRALSGQLRERNRTVKSLEEEMTATAPEHAWSFGKKHHYNLFESRTRRRTPAGVRRQIPAGELSKDLFEDFNIVADKATSTNSLESMLDLIEQSLDTDPEYRESVSHQTGITDGTSYMRLVPQDNPEGMLPPTHGAGRPPKRHIGRISPTVRPAAETAAHTRHGKLQGL